MTRLAAAEGSFTSIRPDESDYFAFDFSVEIGVAATFTGNIVNDTLTVVLIQTGTLQVGHLILGASVVPGTRITALESAQGGAGTYKVDISQSSPTSGMSAVADITEADWINEVVSYSAVNDPTPQARLLSEPSIARNVTSVLIGTMLDGVSYLLTATVTLSDGRVLVSSANVNCTYSTVVQDDVLTVDEFRTIFPAFSDPAKFPDATIAFWIQQATAMPVIDPDRWGQFYNFGIALWVAHVLTIGNAQRMAMQTGTGIGSGTPASKSVNGVSISYDTQFGQELNAGWYGLTPYGNMFLRYLRMAGAGPIQVGTGYFWNMPGTVRNITPAGGRPLLPSWLRPW